MQEGVPRLFKPSVIIQVPKKLDTCTLIDFRPVILPSIAMKCLEELVLAYINSVFPDTVDPLQFAKHPKQSVDGFHSFALYTSTSELQ